MASDVRSVTLSQCGVKTDGVVEAVKVKRGMWIARGQLAAIIKGKDRTVTKVKCAAEGKVVTVEVTKGQDVKPR